MPKDVLRCYTGKKIGFVGLGISNMPVARLMLENGIDVTLRDRKAQPEIDGFRCLFGDGYLDSIDEDILFLAPVINTARLPELIAAKERGVLLTSEMEEFFRLCPCPKIGVTGSDGKTTTTTLIAKMLESAGKKVFLGGNIGVNLFCRLEEITPDDIAVCELSSFQLIKMDISPETAVLKNIAPNHLDWHADMNEYVEAKKNIFRFQQETDRCVLSADNEYTKGFFGDVKGKLIPTSGEWLLENGVSYLPDGIYVMGEKWLDDSDIFIVGKHNRNNFADAIAAALPYITRENVLEVARSFRGVKHRIQYIDTIDGVKYFNSSIDSSPSRTAAALRSFPEKVIVICGGYDKHIPYEPLGELFEQHVKAAVTMGATGGKIRDVLEKAHFDGTVLTASDMHDAVRKAKSVASDGDTVILSPASASFDLFKNFEERGDVFIEEIAKLKIKD